MNLEKKLERYLRVNLLEPGPRLIERRIYRAAVQQRLKKHWSRQYRNGTVCVICTERTLVVSKLCYSFVMLWYDIYDLWSYHPKQVELFIEIQWKSLIVIILGLALFDKNNRVITLSGGYKKLHYLTQFVVTVQHFTFIKNNQ